MVGVEKARTELYGDCVVSFDQLLWYIGVALNANLGSRFHLDCDPMSRGFKRVFVAFHAGIEEFQFCQPLWFVDGTFLNGNYKGTLLAATTKDGNQGIFIYFLCLLLNCWLVWLRSSEISLIFVSQEYFC